MKTAWILFPNQLYEDTTLLKEHDVFLVEEPMFIYDAVHRPIRPNKMKIAFLRAAAKQYAERLGAVRYIDYEVALKDNYGFIARGKYERVMIYDPTDHGIVAKLESHIRVPLIIVESPNFLLSRADLEEFESSRGGDGGAAGAKIKHSVFYEFVKKKLDILVGVKSQDTYNRLPATAAAIEQIDNTRIAEEYTTGKVKEEAIAYAHKIAAGHCGDAEELGIYPTTSDAAYRAFKTFMKARYSKFGPYEDIFLSENPFVQHSVTSPALNAGLLDPRRLVSLAMEHSGVTLNSREGFVRQLIGWREYMRYLYVMHYEELVSANSYRAKRVFGVGPGPGVWRSGTTGIVPYDTELKKAIKYGYAHHIVRLMVFMGLFIIMEIDPAEVYKWFMEVVAIDAYDWVMVGNVYAMGYYYTGAMTRPYISSSAYITRMSDYKKDGTWDKIWDALFYRFISRANGVEAYKRNLAAIKASELKEHIRVANQFLKNVGE